MTTRDPDHAHVDLGVVARAWWPLAASWMLMAVELPLVSAIVARLHDPEVHLAAYGGVVFPIALVVESPIIMLLAASTALSRDAASYRALRRFMHKIGAVLTVLHALVAFTPLYDLIARDLLEVPAEVLGPARVGLAIMLPWTWAIAYRRFNQGVLIRFGFSRVVTVGTAVRLVAASSVLVGGLVLGTIPGTVVAASAVATGVTAEAIYVGIRVRPVVRQHLSVDDPSNTALRGREFLEFYVPLALTPLITLIVLPIGSAAVSRMPNALMSLAVWPIINGLVFMFQGFGLAYNEVVVALLGRPGAAAALRRFTAILSIGTTLLLGTIAVTPLANLWFETVSGLSPALAKMGEAALWVALPIPLLRAIQSWHQGMLVHSRRTGPITESVVAFLLVCSAILFAGVRSQSFDGLTVVVAGFATGRAIQSLWLWIRSRDAVARL